MASRRWPHVRAGLIAFAIFLGMVDGCPLPPRQYVKPWQEDLVAVVRPVQQTVLVPFKWVTRWLRFSQRWALMQAAPRERYRFTVEGRTGEGWRVIYRANDPDHDAFADILEIHHMWGVWVPTDRMMGRYNAFVAWFTAHVLEHRPDLSAVRTSQERIFIEDGELHGTGELTHRMTRERHRR